MRVAKLCLPPCFWPLSRKPEFLPWKQKCSWKIGIWVCFEDRNDFFLACTWIYNVINKCKFLSSNIILWSKHHSSFSIKISSTWLNWLRGTCFFKLSGSCSEEIGEQKSKLFTKVDLFLQCTQIRGTKVFMTLSIDHIILVVSIATIIKWPWDIYVCLKRYI